MPRLGPNGEEMIEVCQLQFIVPGESKARRKISVFSYDLNDSYRLGDTVIGNIIGMLAEAVQQETGGLVVPCTWCGTNRVLVTSDGQRGLSCPDKDCKGSAEFWPVA